jgi:hypothetical protein
MGIAFEANELRLVVHLDSGVLLDALDQVARHAVR